MPSDHALLPPSSAKRWMTCHPSARLEATETRRDTAYSIEGTLAHSVGEFWLTFYRDRFMLPAEDVLLEAKALDKNSLLADLRSQAEGQGIDFDEMLVTVHDNYVTPVIMDFWARRNVDPDATLLIERRIDLSAYIRDGFGSSDAIIISSNKLTVYDLKYGKGVRVEATGNPQMMCYALGALIGPGEPWPIEEVEMCILQPRLHHESRWSVSPEYLLDWGAGVLRPAAELAYHGSGDLVTGDHCRFCAVAARCPALANCAKTLATRGQEPELLDKDEMSEILGQLGTMKAWIAAVEDYALRQALDGDAIPGWKVVAGRSVRKIEDQEAAIRTLEDAGLDPGTYLRPRELRTITELERVLTKRSFNELLGQYVVKPQGKPTLVPESDPRQPFSPAEAAFNDIP